MARDQPSADLASLKIDRGVKPPSGSSKLVVIFVVLAGLALIAGQVVYPQVRDRLFTPRLKLGEVALLSPAQAEVRLTAAGHVVAQVYAKVAAKAPGRIAEIFVEEGQTIEEGARIARLEDSDVKTQLAIARAHAAAAGSRIAAARASLAELEVQSDRAAPRGDVGGTAKATPDLRKIRGASAIAAIHAAEAEAAAFDAEIAALEVRLTSYEITSPIAGTVVDKRVKVGDGVSPGFDTPGLIDVIDLTSLVVEVDVPESRLSLAPVGGPCEIVLDAAPTMRFRGTVKEIGHRVNRSKATVPVTIRFVDQPSDHPIGHPIDHPIDPSIRAASGPQARAGAQGGVPVLPDMAARVSFLTEALDRASLATPSQLVVPRSAVVQRRGGEVVFVFDDGRVRMTAVHVGAAAGGGLALETHLPLGTRVVLEPPGDLTDGQHVTERRP